MSAPPGWCTNQANTFQSIHVWYWVPKSVGYEGKSFPILDFEFKFGTRQNDWLRIDSCSPCFHLALALLMQRKQFRLSLQGFCLCLLYVVVQSWLTGRFKIISPTMFFLRDCTYPKKISRKTETWTSQLINVGFSCAAPTCQPWSSHIVCVFTVW